MSERDSLGGDVRSDVSYFRDSEYPVYYTVLTGVVCHQCGSGAVWKPPQTLDMPMVYNC
jgi:hypothetical protein